jgi:hypothetical protein
VKVVRMIPRAPTGPGQAGIYDRTGTGENGGQVLIEAIGFKSPTFRAARKMGHPRSSHASSLSHPPVSGANETKVMIAVETGRIAYATFGLKSPINESGDVPVGTLVISSEHFLRGEVFIDEFHVGQLEKNGRLTVANVVAGHHSFRIDDVKQSELGQTVVKPGEIQYTVMRPSPPTGLTVIVR